MTVRIGSPITGYGQDTRNRAARQHIPHRAWSDEDGVQRVEVGKTYPWSLNHNVFPYAFRLLVGIS